MKKTFTLFFIFIALLVSASLNAQLVINEVCAKNDTTFTDASGNFGDWIEIYNNSNATINLENYSLTDDYNDPFKWIFESYELNAHDFIVVFADGKDINLTNIAAQNYSELPPYFSTWADDQMSPKGASTISPLEFTDYLGLENGENVYSAHMHIGDNSTTFNWSSSQLNIYLNETKTPLDYSRFSKLIVKATITDGRGIRFRLIQDGLEDWLGFDFVLEGNGIEGFEYEIPLIDNFAKENLQKLVGVKYEAIKPDGDTDIKIYNQTWTKGKSYAHTNFKISANGESVLLYNPTIELVNALEIPQMKADLSYGRSTDGNTDAVLFVTPTPGESNNSSTFLNGYCTDTIIFDLEAGLYNNSISINPQGASEIRYTTDGSTPSFISPLVSSSISVPKTTVIKLGCFDNNSYPNYIYTNTYIINEKTDLPIISISTDPRNFFDYYYGIYANGPNWTPDMPNFGANFWEDWSRPIYIEYFDKDGKIGFEQGAEAKIFGGYSRMNPMKSLKIKAKEDLGGKSFKYKLFENKNNDSFSEFVLRNSGNDFNTVHFHDAIVQESARKNCDLDQQAFQPAVIYINGEYWGIQNIREKINAEYIQDNHGTAQKNIELYEAWGSPIGNVETNFYSLREEIINANMSNNSSYNNYISKFDKESFIDFFAVNCIVSNWDWPQNNLKLWHSKETDKFRYIMYDCDITLGKFDLQNAEFNQIHRLVEAADIGPQAEILSSFLQNESFKNDFINRNADLMNTDFSKEGLNFTIDSIKAILLQEMPKHKERWGGDMYQWNSEIENVKDFIDARIPIAFNQLQEEFNLTKQINLTIQVNPIGAGYIKVNSIIPTSLPWTGIYFDGVPVTITAIANPGYSFSYWKSSETSSKIELKSITNNFTSNTTFTAYFTGSESNSPLIISEINYNSNNLWNTGDWFEVYNSGSSAVDVTGWTIKDKRDYNYYTFLDNTIIQAGGRIVFASEIDSFTTLLPHITPFEIPFKLNSNSDEIRIFDAFGNKYYSVVYNSNATWPIEPNGGGFTLELLNKTANPLLSSSWFAGCEMGSPGVAYDSKCTPLSIEDQKTSVVYAYPNPTVNSMYIYGIDEDFISISVFDISGKTILKQNNYNTSKAINTSYLKSGLYILHIQTSTDDFDLEFIKQ